MGFLDKLLGRAKGTASDLAEQAAPHVDRAVDKAGDLANQAKDAAAPVVEKVQDLAGTGAEKADDLVDRPGHAGSDAGESPSGDPATPPSDSAA